MSSFQQGSVGINSGLETLEVSYGVPFGSPPEVVLALVEYLGAEASFPEVTATLRDRTANDKFTVDFNGPVPSGDYGLVWWAGSSSDLVAVVTNSGRRISQLVLASGVADGDYLPMVQLFPLPTTKRVSWHVLRAHFPNVAGVPGAPTDEGEANMFAVDGTTLYVHNGLGWVRFAGAATAWTTPPRANGQIFEGALGNGVSEFTVTFAQAFDNDPRIIAPPAIFNLVDTGEDLQFLTAHLKSISTTEAVFGLSNATNTANYRYSGEVLAA